MRLDKNLAYLLKQRGMTITELSKQTGVPKQTIHNWLSGMEPRSIKQIKVVSDYLDVNLEELCFKKPQLFNVTFCTHYHGQDEER